MMMSLNMLIELGDAFDYTHADFNGWCLEAGFERTELMPLAGPPDLMAACNSAFSEPPNCLIRPAPSAESDCTSSASAAVVVMAASKDTARMLLVMGFS